MADSGNSNSLYNIRVLAVDRPLRVQKNIQPSRRQMCSIFSVFKVVVAFGLILLLSYTLYFSDNLRHAIGIRPYFIRLYLVNDSSEITKRPEQLLRTVSVNPILLLGNETNAASTNISSNKTSSRNSTARTVPSRSPQKLPTRSPMLLRNSTSGSQAKKNTTSTPAPPIPQPYDQHAEPLPSFENIRNLKQHLRMHCRTCAFVSSSGQVLNRHAGPHIDSHECVFRTNTAPVKRYERDVGRRTTVRVTNFHAIRTIEGLIRSAHIDKVVVWGPDVVLGPGKPVLKVAQNLARKFPKTEFYKFSSKAMVDVDVEFKKETGMDRRGSKTDLSTGWFALTLMRQVCDSTTIFGMVYDGYCATRNASVPDVPYHYYGKSALECSMYTGKGGKTKHKFVQEKTIFGRWAKNYNFTFVHPEWPPIQR
ncbi:alpha-N-acetyl-neuraminyl-2,3-beta-galactosyl-1,3-N-acetyl-galactosaminide alpha-2,6-sialyltransferase-like isoform X1 [Branchiostoma floridae]|uniref:Alpha-N-acetyl-neuraminyl-2,3-beta-galactosyl-1, 3-N-acetyl-galactosaminide alpha-2,6-sialyltransferase-like isoform X1 n=1 Tax=Branchiostoma floridae TaxID=7739 RepID=A0A9J7MNX0_BRAFL|nr:alpha-N-acetyl-neuraminyl-2,3-beta-galactosyl-1,3-N-acetyl-galactosaminide alpha-2,6-sialyltransferase-like isoform X1 [Branchiostoma floridae]XP_035674180.1 alpha-N-acetyl-neuraminyl-2,3-beta-galactosyl-1,3-N-acetyl-galactosaminide alpha-2,6-sialyltransferase-like isoform X1 [Branchiostoma floridae]XP_035674181.1 alpha-N-acetyl-neuraminyl-2,3-beta-galactosyl-1,3-N-acetyl-galactosaminide alpha-2,6-sialyltransferase-like isoform X1 [Branchiostoma floridae]XP_035674182.1 alpha-N-acetyl-neuramin